MRTLTADYCVSTIPMPIFKTLRDQSAGAPTSDAARKLPVQAAGKVGWQAERFWETKDQIYGGISWTTDVITQIWYPSSGYLSAKGTLTGAYMYGAPADEFNAQPVAERLRIAREQGERLHPDYVEIRRARGRDRLEQHGVRAHGLGRRGRSGVRGERAKSSRRRKDASHGRRSDHLVDAAGRKAPCISAWTR